MKPKTLLATLALTLSMAACGPKDDDLTTSVMDIYEQYADHSEMLTVAFVGDYMRNGHLYNAIMLRAEDDEQWQWLKDEFGILDMEDLATVADTTTPDGQPHGIIIKPLEIPEEVMLAGDEAVQQYVDSLADALRREILGDSARLALSPIVTDAACLPEGSFREKMNRQSDMVRFSQQHGDAGYILNADITNHTLWLFFYGREDMVIGN